MILAGMGVAGAAAHPVHDASPAAAASGSSRTRRHLGVNEDCRTNLKLFNFDKWCYDLPIATCDQYYYVATPGKFKVLHSLVTTTIHTPQEHVALWAVQHEILHVDTALHHPPTFRARSAVCEREDVKLSRPTMSSVARARRSVMPSHGT